MQKLKLLFILILSSLILISCSNKSSKTEVQQVSGNTHYSNKSETLDDYNLEEEKDTLDNENSANSNDNSTDTSVTEDNTSENTLEKTSDNTSDNTSDYSEQAVNNTSENSDISQKTKDYILYGQDGIPEAGKIQWSETFLNQVNIDDVYQKYLANGGTADDIESFAQYLTLNAPVSDNWKDMFAADLYKAYEVKVSHIEHIQDELYQAYVIIDGSEVPYVAVNARTGYYHG